MQVILYHTLGCHLCELAEDVIDDLQQAFPQLSIQTLKIDIADSAELVAQYGVQIPVVKVQGQAEALAWPFDAGKLQRYLNIS